MSTNDSYSFLGMYQVAFPKGWHLEPHQHDYHELILVRRGQLRLKMLGEEVMIGPGHAVWYPSDEAHEEWNEGEEELELSFALFEWSLHTLIEQIWVQQDRRGRMATMADWLMQEREIQHGDRQIWASSVFHALISEFLRLSEGQVEPLVAKVRAYMNTCLSEPIKVEDLAKVVHLSKYHFIRVYKERSGVTPMEDLRRIRLHAARERIISTRDPLKQIASEVGLGDEYQLSRLFRKYFGTPPSGYR